MKTQPEHIAHIRSIHDATRALKKSLQYALADAITTAMPTISLITYEWECEFNDNGRYDNYVDQVTLVLTNNSVITYRYACGDIEDVEFMIGDQEAALFKAGDETSLFIAHGLMHDEFDWTLSFLTDCIDALIHAMGENIESLDIEEIMSAGP